MQEMAEQGKIENPIGQEKIAEPIAKKGNLLKELEKLTKLDTYSGVMLFKRLPPAAQSSAETLLDTIPKTLFVQLQEAQLPNPVGHSYPVASLIVPFAWDGRPKS